MKIRVLTKRPGCIPRSTWIENSLKNLQRYVGGDIAVYRFATDAVFVFDKDGKANGKDYNCTICGVNVFGDAIFCGVNGDEYADLPIEYREAKRLFQNLWKL